MVQVLIFNWVAVTDSSGNVYVLNPVESTVGTVQVDSDFLIAKYNSSGDNPMATQSWWHLEMHRLE